MSKHDDGGPAFPCEAYDCPQDTDPTLFPGMSLRDWFAGQALAGAMSSAEGLGTIAPCERMAMLEGMAGILYECADAMLAARRRTDDE